VAKRKNQKNSRKSNGRKKGPFRIDFLEETKKKIWGVILATLSLILILSFLDLAGPGGNILKVFSTLLIGRVAFLLPPLFIFLSILFFKTEYRKIYLPVLFGFLVIIIGISGILGLIQGEEKIGGHLGYWISRPTLALFDFWASFIIFLTLSLIGVFILSQFFFPKKEREQLSEKSPSLIRKIFLPKFEVKEIPPVIKEEKFSSPEAEKIPISQQIFPLELKIKPINGGISPYQSPPLNLLENDSGVPSAGDIKTNSAIIKRTLQNFDIPVEMGQVNIGPTVTQYTLKPAEGVKLSKITALNNDLSLALAAHPIRIEAPIPGKSLVGIEIPNKVRTLVRLRSLIGHPDFQRSISNLTFALGRDVMGSSVFADLGRMPHLLIAGSTGTGKSICLNNLIVSLLYKNSPEILKFILIDPKRVEFPIYNSLEHLLTPVILDTRQAVNVIKWLIGEMERRFEIFGAQKSRDILRYNEMMANTRQNSLLPYIVLIIDELADLMAARGKEIEAGIVRLAQMARAVGIHLVVATQRPSVEVVTGLIKANITSRIAFQVASQVDSRTVFDMAGAEKLLGSGDMLYISSDVAKPKRIQTPYVSEKEIKRVVDWFKSKNQGVKTERIELEELEKSVANELSNEEGFDIFAGGEDPLYEEAKRLVIEARKASASLLQRRLRIGYARAARLLDMLEEKSVVGPGEGAKPREVYNPNEEP